MNIPSPDYIRYPFEYYELVRLTEINKDNELKSLDLIDYAYFVLKARNLISPDNMFNGFKVNPVSPFSIYKKYHGV